MCGLISIVLPDGDSIVNILDVLIAQQILNGQLSISLPQMKHGDVAPLIGGIPAPDGIFNVADVLVITKKSVGEITY